MDALNHIDRDLLFLPDCLGGMGIININLCHSSFVQYRVSTIVTPFVDLMFSQTKHFLIKVQL